jgi:hypothetical protein
LSIENSIDRLAAAIESLAAAVSTPVVVPAPSQCGVDINPVRVEPRPATEAEKAEIAAAADAAAAKKPRGRPRKQGNIEKFDVPGPTADHPGYEVTVEKLEQDPTSAAADTAAATDTASETSTKESAVPAKEQASASTATAAAGSTESQTSAPATVESNISKGDIVQILTGLQKKLEESATTIEEKRGAAQKCRDLIKSVVGSESLKDAKPEHFGRIKSAVLKVLNNE